uniref:mannosyl-oligosaccharide glucosidase n=1 Tax=Heterosigma akashiwo TaxID=2829 RepID=A0A7S3XS34_HETAK
MKEKGGFYDLGPYSESGVIEQRIVLRCVNNDRAHKDIDISMKQYENLESVTEETNPCPRQFPHIAFPLGDGKGGLLTREKYAPGPDAEYGHVRHTGYPTVLPLALRLLRPGDPRLGRLLALLRDENELWSPHGVRSLSKSDLFYGRENAPGDAPYWRGYIWINMNYLVLDGLHHYGAVDGPYRERCRALYEELRENVMQTVLGSYERTGYFWEQYHDVTGQGLRSHPFTGWTALVLHIMGETYH